MLFLMAGVVASILGGRVKALPMIGVVALAASNVAAQRYSPAPRRLELAQLTTVSLPGTLAVSGAQLLSHSRVLVWSYRDGRVVVADSANLDTLCRERRIAPIAASARPGDGRIEIVDGVSHRVVYVSTNGACADGAVMPGATSPLAAARLLDGWVLLVEDSLGAARVEVLDVASGRTRRLASTLVGGDFEARHTRLWSSDSMAVMSSMTWPFAWVAFTRSGRVVARGKAFERDTVVSAANDTSRSGALIGLSVLRVGNGFVQVAADPRSDLRVTVTYDSAGHVANKSAVDVAIGLLDASADPPRVLILSRTEKWLRFPVQCEGSR